MSRYIIKAMYLKKLKRLIVWGRQPVLIQFENPHWKGFYISAVPHLAQNSVLTHPYKLGTHIHSFMNVLMCSKMGTWHAYLYCGKQNKIQLTQLFTCIKSVIEVKFLHVSSMNNCNNLWQRISCFYSFKCTA